jgi:hypothetical protein
LAQLWSATAAPCLSRMSEPKRTASSLPKSTASDLGKAHSQSDGRITSIFRLPIWLTDCEPLTLISVLGRD